MTIDKNASKSSANARGGYARAEALPPEERSKIARDAALARWDADIPKATYYGSFRLGATDLDAAVLPNGKRLLTQGPFLRALGRSRSPKGGTGVLSTVDGLPSFLQAESLKAFISDDLRASTTPILFRTPAGKRAVGYEAQLLPMVAEVYLHLRDTLAAEGKLVPQTLAHVVAAADVVIRGLARVGIAALVDEATGYQDVRDRQALQALLDQFLLKKFAAWAKRFPDEFYKEMFRLRGWEWRGMTVNRPWPVAQYTRDIVYARLAPGLLAELERRNPTDESGRRKAKHHMWLMPDLGHPMLAQHIHAVVGFMRASDSWKQFMGLLDRAFPRRGDTLRLPLFSTPPAAAPASVDASAPEPLFEQSQPAGPSTTS
ncbi:MAG TPA: P63C domain-containing protein [Planctomycetota bacterium]|jgi:hypothetical protein|nr:P63C domain-containing protein [Planctomycetota bacterium]